MKIRNLFALFLIVITSARCGGSQATPRSASPNEKSGQNSDGAASPAEESTTVSTNASGPSATSASASPATRGAHQDEIRFEDDKTKKDSDRDNAPTVAKGVTETDDLAHAQQTWNEARKRIFADKISAGQCEQMCKALESMRRATGRICELVGSTSDAYKCTEAKAKLVDAEAKVKASCGACAANP